MSEVPLWGLSDTRFWFLRESSSHFTRVGNAAHVSDSPAMFARVSSRPGGHDAKIPIRTSVSFTCRGTSLVRDRPSP